MSHEHNINIETLANSDRYSRQVIYAPIGIEGQRKLIGARVTQIGCGALGAHLADTMVRSGLGTLRLIDPDRVEMSNLQRQTLYDTEDALAGRPKVQAAADKLRRINPDCSIEVLQVWISPQNIEVLIAGSDLVLDAVDNFQVRYLINQACIKHNIPWIHGGCLGAAGNGLVVVPGGKPCFACVLPEPPQSTVTCNEVGIIAPAVGVIAAWQATQAIKYLTENHDSLDRSYFCYDLWNNMTRRLNLGRLQSGCQVCTRHKFDLLP